ncbi:hypothetical protein TSAR_013624, partial [Trichomalopsis sarcophagae]
EHARSTLYDIFACECNIVITGDCSRPPINKVPLEMKSFLSDPRTTRLMNISTMNANRKILAFRGQDKQKIINNKSNTILQKERLQLTLKKNSAILTELAPVIRHCTKTRQNYRSVQ